MTGTSLSLPRRIWLAFVCAFRVLFDASFAARVAELSGASAQPGTNSTAAKTTSPPLMAEVAQSANGALQLLALLQREGRLVDFLEQDVTSFSDADIGAAARVVHEGCRRALHGHARVVSVQSESEGTQLTLEQAREDVKLVGNVAGAAPYHGVLRHRGWRVEGLTLPTRVGSHDAQVVAPAELEL